MYVHAAHSQSTPSSQKTSETAGCCYSTPCWVGAPAHTATGGSAIQAIKVLLDHGVKPERIIFLNMIASPEGLRSIWDAFPQVRVISAWVDTKLSEQNYSRSHYAHTPVLPGLGDYGDRYYSG